MTNPVLTYFSMVRPIAAAVGVTLPTDTQLAARHAETEDIDLEALAADGAALGALGRAVASAVAASDTVRAGLPIAWIGPASDAASASMDHHRGSVDATLTNVRSATAAAHSAVDGLSRVIAAKNSVLRDIPSGSVVGRPLAEVTEDDVAARREAIAAEIGAKLVAFETAVGTAASAAAGILTVVAEAVGAIRVESYPDVRQSLSGQHGDCPDRNRSSTMRPDPVADVGTTRVRPALDSPEVTAADAVIASASAIVTATVAGVDALVETALDEVLPDNSSHDPAGSESGPHSTAARMNPDGTEPDHRDPDSADPKSADPKTADPKTANPESVDPDGGEPTTPRPPPRSSLLNLDTTPGGASAHDQAGVIDAHPFAPTSPERHTSESTPAESNPTESDPTESGRDSRAEKSSSAHPEAGWAGRHPSSPTGTSSSAGTSPPTGTGSTASQRSEPKLGEQTSHTLPDDDGSDPEDGGGLALAGDR